MSAAILVFSTGLFFFYLQTLCEKVLRREFSRPFYQDVLKAFDLEYLRVCQALSVNTPMDYSDLRRALKSAMVALKFLGKKANPKQGHSSLQERVSLGYFQLLLHWLPIRHAFHVRETQSVIKLTLILHYLANLVGERVISMSSVSLVARQEL